MLLEPMGKATMYISTSLVIMFYFVDLKLFYLLFLAYNLFPFKILLL